MRRVLSYSLLVVVCGAAASGQAMTEAAAAAAGGTVGGVAGKKVSDGVTSIFNKIDKQTSKAAADAKAAKGKEAPAATKSGASTLPLIEAGPGKPDYDGFVPPVAPRAGSGAAKSKAKENSTASVVTPKAGEPPPQGWVDVPPPPPLEHQGAVAPVRPAPRPVAVPPPAPVVLVPVTPPPPPPPVPVTVEDLQTIENGMTREDVLKIGKPSARITMFENGGLLEIFTYRTHDPLYGDKSVATVRLNDGTVSAVDWRP